MSQQVGAQGFMDLLERLRGGAECVLRMLKLICLTTAMVRPEAISACLGVKQVVSFVGGGESRMVGVENSDARTRMS
ncbi:hypothetical protein IP70_13055 [alpha proteobacterium AAP38]|nr:hypothetical protein IP70_13055 [alpha proteobacterium AAP38]